MGAGIIPYLQFLQRARALEDRNQQAQAYIDSRADRLRTQAGISGINAALEPLQEQQKVRRTLSTQQKWQMQQLENSEAAIDARNDLHPETAKRLKFEIFKKKLGIRTNPAKIEEPVDLGEVFQPVPGLSNAVVNTRTMEITHDRNVGKAEAESKIPTQGEYLAEQLPTYLFGGETPEQVDAIVNGLIRQHKYISGEVEVPPPAASPVDRFMNELLNPAGATQPAGAAAPPAPEAAAPAPTPEPTAQAPLVPQQAPGFFDVLKERFNAPPAPERSSKEAVKKAIKTLESFGMSEKDMKRAQTVRRTQESALQDFPPEIRKRMQAERKRAESTRADSRSSEEQREFDEALAVLARAERTPEVERILNLFPAEAAARAFQRFAPAPEEAFRLAQASQKAGQKQALKEQKQQVAQAAQAAQIAALKPKPIMREPKMGLGLARETLRRIQERYGSFGGMTPDQQAMFISQAAIPDEQLPRNVSEIPEGTLSQDEKGRLVEWRPDLGAWKTID